MAKASGKSQRLSLYNNSLNLAMSFYIAPYRYFSYIFPYIGVFCLYKTLSFLLYLAQTVVFWLYIYNRYTDYWCFLIYRRNPLFSFVFCPSLIYSVFPIVKITLFCLYISFYFAQIVVYVFLIYIWKLDIFPEKYVFYYIYIYRRKTLFLMYFPYIHRIAIWVA